MQRIAPSDLSVLCLSENLVLKTCPLAHLSILLLRGRRPRIQVAFESRTIGATVHNDYSFFSYQGEGKWSTAHVFLVITDIRVSRPSTT